MDTDSKGAGDAGGTPGVNAPNADRRSVAGTPRGPGKRGVDKKYKWTHGHDPNDDDARPDSGWVYVKWEVTEHGPTPPDQAQGLRGGPPSGVPCPRCKEDMRMVARKSALDIMENSEVVRPGESPPQDADQDALILLACPRCYQKQQWRESALTRLRRRLGTL